MKRLFLGMIALVFYSQSAVANTDLLGLANLAEGSTPSYGENTVVGMNESTGVKFLQNRGDPGKLSFPVDLSGEFDVSFRLGTSFGNGGGGIDFSLIASDDSYITASFKYSWIDFGTYSDYRPDGWKDDNNSPINDVRLNVSNGVAKLYLNDVFFSKMTLSSPDLKYTKLNLSGFARSEKVYALSTTGQSASLAPSQPSQGSTPLATIAPNLDIQIPNANYQTLGGAMNLWVNLKFAPSPDGRLLWELTDYGLVGQ